MLRCTLEETQFMPGKLNARDSKAFSCSTYLIPLRCIILKMMVAFVKNRIKKSTISATNRCASEGMTNSRPVTETVHVSHVLLR